MLKKMSVLIAMIALLGGSAAAQPRPAQKPSPKPQPTEQAQPQPAPPPGSVGSGLGAAPPSPAEMVTTVARTEPQGQPVNVRLDLTITDQTGPGEPTKKVVTMFVAERQNGSIRTQGSIRDSATGSWRNVTINVDARPYLQRERGERSTGPVRVELGLEYQPTAPANRSDSPIPASLNERITVYVENGKPLTISQAADPISDRRITVELKATIVQ